MMQAVRIGFGFNHSISDYPFIGRNWVGSDARLRRDTEIMHGMEGDATGGSPMEAERAPTGYHLIRRIGRGSFGECWLARHDLTGCPVAIKCLTRRPDYELTKREIALWSRLDHERIIRLYEVSSWNDRIYIVSEYADKGDLFTLMTKHPRGLPEKEAMEIFAQLRDALAFLHGQNIAHRDVKLENVFLAADHRVKLGDFGFATPTDGGTLCEEWLGSIEYAAPEVLNHEPYDPILADSWSLGIILFVLLKGYLPFSRVEDDCRGMFDRDRTLKRRILGYDLVFPDDVSVRARDLLTGLLRYDPKGRLRVEDIPRYEAILHCHADAPAPIATEKLFSRISLSILPGIRDEMQKVDFDVSPVGAICRIVRRNPTFIAGSRTRMMLMEAADAGGGEEVRSERKGGPPSREDSDASEGDDSRTEEDPRRPGWFASLGLFGSRGQASSSYTCIQTENTEDV